MWKLFFQNRRRAFIILFSVGIALLFLIVASSYSLLTVSSTNSEIKNVYIKNDDGVKEFVLGSGSKTLVLKRGEYIVEVSKDDKVSFYSQTLGLFGNSKLGIELLSQKASDYRGSNELPCSLDNPNDTIVYYSCRPSTLSLIRPETAVRTPPQSDDEGNIDSAFISLKPYKDGFLEAKLNKNSVLVRFRDKSGAYANQPATVLRNFRGALNDRIFAVNEDLDSFALLDDSKNVITKFSSIGDKNPKIIRIANGELTNNPNYDTTLSTTKDNVYVFNYIGYPDLDASEESLPPQLILVYGENDELVKKHELPTEWSIRSITSNSGSMMGFLASSDAGNQTYLLKGTEKPRSIIIPSSQAEEICWKNNDSFYYLSDGGVNIYLYSLTKRASYLVYSGLTETTKVSGLNCVANNLGFNVSSEADGESAFIHYGLGGGDHTGTRLESLLPLYFELEKDTFKLSANKNGLVISTIYDEQAANSPSKEQVETLAKTRLSEKGVSTAGLNIIFGF